MFGSRAKTCVPIPKLINYQTTIPEISKQIRAATEAKGGEPIESPPTLDLMQGITHLVIQLASMQHNLGFVFLTDAGGFIAIQIFQEVLERSDFKKVIAYLYSLSNENDRQRIIAAAKFAR